MPTISFLKRVLSRLQEQVKKRLPERDAEDLVAVLLDPLTKPFAPLWLGTDGYCKARRLLKKQHRELYVKIMDKPEEENPQELNDVPASAESLSSDDEDVVDCTADNGEDESADLEADADKLFDKWIKFKPDYNNYLYEGVDKIRDMTKCTITELIDKFDTAKYFKVCWSLIPFQLCYTTNLMNTFVLQDHGKENFLVISILARVYLSRFETGAEQERVFSSAKHAMDKDQARMNFDMLKMRTLLSHNKHLIRRGIINICD